MTTPYCLLDEAWIPILRESGHREFVRPCDLTTATTHGSILRVATGRPDCDISLTEFLIGLLAVALGPETNREWAERYRAPPTAEELEAALRPFERALVLDGDGPRFFQDLEAFEHVGPNIRKRVELLFVDAPGENALDENSDHFVKRNAIQRLSRAGAAIALLTIQTVSPSGGPGKLTSLRGGGPLTTLAIPAASDGSVCLWQTLWLNVPSDLRLKQQDLPQAFPWLTSTRLGAKSGIKTTPEDVHAAQAFFGLPRRIRLSFEGNVAQQPCDLLGILDDHVVAGFFDRPKGTDYDCWSRAHPLTPYKKNTPTDTVYIPANFKTTHQGYRFWLACVYGTADSLRVPAKNIASIGYRIHTLPRSERPNCRMLAAGYAMDKAKPLDFAEAAMPLIVTGDTNIDTEIRDVARRFVDAANEAANQLVRAVRLALYGEKGKADNGSTVLEPVRSRFWADTEDAFFATLHDLARRHEAPPRDSDDASRTIFDASAQAWIKTLRHHALAIFDETVPIDSAESGSITGLIKARKALVLMFEGWPP